MEDQEMVVRATKSQIEDIKESLFWKDVIQELEAWKKGFGIERNNIVDNCAKENHTTATVLLHMGDINGRIKTVNYLLSLPDIFLSLLEEQKENKNDT